MNNQISEIVSKVSGVIEPSVGVQQFAVFDFDNTCIEHDIAEALLSYLCTNQLLKNSNLLDSLIEDSETYHRKVLARYYELLEKGEVSNAYQFTTQMIAEFTESEIAELVSKTIISEGVEIGTKVLFGIEVAKGLRLRTDVITLLKSLKEQNIAIWIVSASPEAVVTAALQYYNIPGTCIGMRLEKDGDILTDTIIEPLSTLEGKVLCIQKYIDPIQRPILGIGDSMNDFPMINYSHIKVVVDRNNKLAEEAKQNDWFLITE